VVDNMVLCDPGNLLPRDPAARYRHAEGPYLPIVNPRAMSVDVPRAPEAVETESWGRMMGRRMVTAGRELSSGFGWHLGPGQVPLAVAPRRTPQRSGSLGRRTMIPPVSQRCGRGLAAA
jgi:hypothetical protein